MHASGNCASQLLPNPDQSCVMPIVAIQLRAPESAPQLSKEITLGKRVPSDSNFSTEIHDLGFPENALNKSTFFQPIDGKGPTSKRQPVHSRISLLAEGYSTKYKSKRPNDYVVGERVILKDSKTRKFNVTGTVRNLKKRKTNLEKRLNIIILRDDTGRQCRRNSASVISFRRIEEFAKEVNSTFKPMEKTWTPIFKEHEKFFGKTSPDKLFYPDSSKLNQLMMHKLFNQSSTYQPSDVPPTFGHEFPLYQMLIEQNQQLQQQQPISQLYYNNYYSRQNSPDLTYPAHGTSSPMILKDVNGDVDLDEFEPFDVLPLEVQLTEVNSKIDLRVQPETDSEVQQEVSPEVESKHLRNIDEIFDEFDKILSSEDNDNPLTSSSHMELEDQCTTIPTPTTSHHPPVVIRFVRSKLREKLLGEK